MFCGIEYVEFMGILRGILSVPQNIVMDLNNVMVIHDILLQEC